MFSQGGPECGISDESGVGATLCRRTPIELALFGCLVVKTGGEDVFELF